MSKKQKTGRTYYTNDKFLPPYLAGEVMNEIDKQIVDLKRKRMSKEKWVAINDTVNLIDEHIEIRNCDASYICKELNQKDHELAVMKKALELVCEYVVKEYYGSYEIANGYGLNPIYFINKAKEMLKNE